MIEGQLDIFQCIEIAERGLDGKPATERDGVDGNRKSPPGAMRTAKSPVCPVCGLDMIEPADRCGFCAEEERRMESNEGRADLGVRAVAVAATAPHALFEPPIVTAIEDTLTYIAHACDRFGLHAPAMFRDGLRAYQRQLANDGPRAEFSADGDHLTLTEAEYHATPATAVA